MIASPRRSRRWALFSTSSSSTDSPTAKDPVRYPIFGGSPSTQRQTLRTVVDHLVRREATTDRSLSNQTFMTRILGPVHVPFAPRRREAVTFGARAIAAAPYPRELQHAPRRGAQSPAARSLHPNPPAPARPRRRRRRLRPLQRRRQPGTPTVAIARKYPRTLPSSWPDPIRSVSPSKPSTTGRHRRSEPRTIDPRGDLDGLDFADAPGLGAALADHDRLGACLASHLQAATMPASVERGYGRSGHASPTRRFAPAGRSYTLRPGVPATRSTQRRREWRTRRTSSGHVKISSKTSEGNPRHDRTLRDDVRRTSAAVSEWIGFHLASPTSVFLNVSAMPAATGAPSRRVSAPGLYGCG